MLDHAGPLVGPARCAGAGERRVGEAGERAGAELARHRDRVDEALLAAPRDRRIGGADVAVRRQADQAFSLY